MRTVQQCLTGLTRVLENLDTWMNQGTRKWSTKSRGDSKKVGVESLVFHCRRIFVFSIYPAIIAVIICQISVSVTKLGILCVLSINCQVRITDTSTICVKKFSLFPMVHILMPECWAKKV